MIVDIHIVKIQEHTNKIKEPVNVYWSRSNKIIVMPDSNYKELDRAEYIWVSRFYPADKVKI